jgi:hypothetical protein
MVNMANCANVAMRLGTVKLFLGHLAFALFLDLEGRRRTTSLWPV